MKNENECSSGKTACACTYPAPIVLVGSYYYNAVPVSPSEAPTCQNCSERFTGPWKLGQAVGLDNPYICGQPKKNGTPCGWVITTSPCAVHLSPEELERERVRQEEQAQRDREAEQARQDRTLVRRQNLVLIFSVECRHCSAPAGELCRNPRGAKIRPIHQARRRLAGVHEPKEFVIEARDHSWPLQRVDEPPLDGSLRLLLDDPLEDRTAEASEWLQAEEEEEAQQKLHKAQRDLWLLSEPREQAVAAVPCRLCGAPAETPCAGKGKFGRKPHTERVDDAMELDEARTITP